MSIRDTYWIASTCDGSNQNLNGLHALEEEAIIRKGCSIFDSQTDPILSVVTGGTLQAPLGALPPLDTKLVASRFAAMRRSPELGLAVIEIATTRATLHLLRPEAGILLIPFGSAVTVHELLSALTAQIHCDGESRARSVLSLAFVSGALLVDEPRALGYTDNSEDLICWEPHSLFFHWRSRRWGNSNKIGATFRFKNRIASPRFEIDKHPNAVETRIALPAVDLVCAATNDPPLTTVIEARRSIRNYGSPCVSIEQLSELLYRTLRRRSLADVGGQLFESRPHPSGGGSYELETYLTISECSGMPSGFYHYDATSHSLVPLSASIDDITGILKDAHEAAAGLGTPQVLLTFGARFSRVSWKYEGMPYAVHLKNVGILYAHLYLVATALGLGACALGLGDSDRFSRMTSRPIYAEGSVGEFMLGSVSNGQLQ